MPPTPSRQRLRRSLAVALIVACAGLLACGEPTREAKLRDAQEELVDAEAELERAREELETRQRAYDAAVEAREQAQDKVRKAESRLEAARNSVGLYATDDVLFRAVQQKLLEDEKLRGVAIAATVHEARVTLSGDVPDAALRDRAVEVASKVPGVVQVTSEIRVVRPEPEPEA